MAPLKKYFNHSANSILESVIALSIISICLYIAVMVYASVFTPKTSPKFYTSRNKITELYYLMQLSPDSIDALNTDNLKISHEWINASLQQIDIEFKDSSGVIVKNNFFIQN